MKSTRSSQRAHGGPEEAGIQEESHCEEFNPIEINYYNGKIQDVVRAHRRTFSLTGVGRVAGESFMPKGGQKPNPREPYTQPRI